MKYVQISYELFIYLVQYHLMGNTQDESQIKTKLENKLDAMVNRELYGKYKTASEPEEREYARQEYLNRRGISETFRW